MRPAAFAFTVVLVASLLGCGGDDRGPGKGAGRAVRHESGAKGRPAEMDAEQGAHGGMGGAGRRPGGPPPEKDAEQVARGAPRVMGGRPGPGEAAEGPKQPKAGQAERKIIYTG